MWQDALLTLIRVGLEEDMGQQGDVTSQAILGESAVINGHILAKADGVLAGIDALLLVYTQIDPDVQIKVHLADGVALRAGDCIAEVRGSAHSVLQGERLALNFLQRLSGIATQTALYVRAVMDTGAVILDTRKTTPGWRLLEKYAVRMGGGQNHRFGLYDMVLIKDNHIDAVGGISAAIEAVQRSVVSNPSLPVVVEVRNIDELRDTLRYSITRILLDNMPLDVMRQAVEITAGRVPLEASGGVSLSNVRDIAMTGVNYISVGALTHSAPAFDLSLQLAPISVIPTA